MKTWHKGLIIGGTALAVLVPAGLVAADQMGNGEGRGNGSMQQHCDRADMQQRAGSNAGRMNGSSGMQARDGSGPRHAQNAATTTTVKG